MRAIYITVPSGAEQRHPLPPDMPVSAEEVAEQLTSTWLHEHHTKVMLPDGACYEREHVMGIRCED